MNIREGAWRTSSTPRAKLPFGARSAGHAELEPGWEHNAGTITWYNIYWAVSGEGGPTVNDKPVPIPGRHIAVHYPGDRIGGYPIQQAWRYRWVTIDGPHAGDVLAGLGLVPPFPRLAGACPLDLFDQLEEELRDITVAGEYTASATAYQILALAARGDVPPDMPGDLVARCEETIRERLDDPALDVAFLARHLGVHRSHLCRIFKARLGVPPVEYIRRARINRGLSLLRRPGYSVKEVARRSGFADPAYFSRCIREATGVGPREFRRLQ